MLKNYLVSDDKDINFALKKINKNRFKTLLVLNNNKDLVGTVSDGDIRRGILKYNNLKIKISKIYNKNFIQFNKILDIKKKDEIFLKKDIDIIPYLKNNKINKIFFNSSNQLNSNLDIQKLKNLSSVIIAGGLGTRLEPYNKIFPKPLMPYKNNSLLKEIITRFENFAINNFIIVTNYKSNEIKKYISTIKSKSKIKLIKKNIKEFFCY